MYRRTSSDWITFAHIWVPTGALQAFDEPSVVRSTFWKTCRVSSTTPAVIAAHWKVCCGDPIKGTFNHYWYCVMLHRSLYLASGRTAIHEDAHLCWVECRWVVESFRRVLNFLHDWSATRACNVWLFHLHCAQGTLSLAISDCVFRNELNFYGMLWSCKHYIW